jgi:hypothetical protein
MAEDESLALVPPGGVLSSPSESQSERSTLRSRGSALVYSGVSIGALGLVTLGVGAYFGFDARSTNTRIDGIESGPQGTPQLEARRLNQRAEDSAGRANLLFAIGGLATAAGATLLVVDLWLLGPSHSAAVSVTSDGEAILGGVSVQW